MSSSVNRRQVPFGAAYNYSMTASSAPALSPARCMSANYLTRYSKLPVQSAGKNIHRPAIGIVSRIGDELIIQRDPYRRGQRIAVISLDDVFVSGMG